MEIEPRPGGFRKPISTREFILSYIKDHGEAYPAEMHRAYKDALLAITLKRLEALADGISKGQKPRVRKYIYPRYHTFAGQVWNLAQEGLIELSRTEPTRGRHDQFKGFDQLPELHYYKLKGG